MTTERLGFRHWTEADLPLAVALWGNAEVMRYMGGPMPAEAARERLELELGRQQRFGFQYWPVFAIETGEHAGCAGLRPFHDSADVLEIGVHIARPFWSGRFGEEAARAVIAWAIENTDAAALVAGHFPENAHSKALIERLGFVWTHEEPWGPTQAMHPYYRLGLRTAALPRELS